MGDSRLIIVYGASGRTGSLLCEALARAGHALALVGRDLGRIGPMAARLGAKAVQAGVHDHAALVRAFSGGEIVVNCAGPFARIGEPVLSAAIEANCHYLDIASEPAFLRAMYERYESAARQRQVIVVNGCGMEIAIGDWAASAAAEAIDGRPLDSVTVSYAFDRLQSRRQRAIDAISGAGYRWEDDRWLSSPPARLVVDTEFPEPFGPRRCVSFPSAEVITVPRHVDTRRVETFLGLPDGTPMSRAATMVAPVVAPLLGPLLRSPLGELARASIDAALPRAAEPTTATGFAVVGEARLTGERSTTKIRGNDVPELSARIALLCAERLREHPPRRVGILAPAQLLPGREALRILTGTNLLTIELP